MSSPLAASPYEVLGVPADAVDAELRRAYRLRLRQTHPDTGGEAAAFIEVKRAWELIGTPDARREYDAAAARSSARWAPRRPGTQAEGGPGAGTAGGADPRAATRSGGSRAGWRGTRPPARSIGTPGGRRRALYLQVAAALGVGEDRAYTPAFVGAAPREVRRLLADALAEEATADVLEGLGMGFTAWHGVLAGDEPALDHAVLAPSGLIALASEDPGGPVRVRRGELIGAGLGERTPLEDLVLSARAVARTVRVRFGAALLILPDDTLAEPFLPVGPVRGLTTAVVRRSALALALRSGVPGARVVGGPEMLETRTRLLSALRVWGPTA